MSTSLDIHLCICIDKSCTRHELGYNKMKEDIKTKFWISFTLIVIVLAVLLSLYFSHFNGEFSDNSADWNNFSGFVSNITIMLLTALNVFVVFRLTSTIAKKEELDRHLRLMLDVKDSFNNCLYAVFQPDEENNICDIREKYITREYDQFNYFKEMGIICKTFTSEKYDAFVNEYNEFARLYFHGMEEEIGNKKIEQRAYDIYMSAREIERMLFIEINQSQKV